LGDRFACEIRYPDNLRLGIRKLVTEFSEYITKFSESH
jgi:hypothetical protein